MKKFNKNRIVAIVLTSLVLGFTGSAALFAATPASVDLLSASNFVILSKAGITNVPTSAITGNIGTSPITGASIAGLDCVEVTGTIYTVDATGPACAVIDPTLLTTAVSDMETVYTDLAGRPAGVGPFLNVGAGTVTDLTLVPGIYTWGSNVTIPTDLTLDAQGDANAIWIFQITGTLDIASGKQVILSGGAQAKNVFWQVADVVTLGVGSHFEGTILAQTNIAMLTGATLNGRALAQTAVTLQSNTVSVPVTVPAPVLADVTLLVAAKVTAQGLITANATESITPGDHIVGSLATLTSAEAVANATNVSAQSVVDAQVVTLNAAIAAYNVAIIASPEVLAPVMVVSAPVVPILATTPPSTGYGNGDNVALAAQSYGSGDGSSVVRGITLQPYVTPSVTPVVTSVVTPVGATVLFSGLTGSEQVLVVSKTHNFTRNLTRGSKGDDVKELQNQLLAAGFYSYDITGYFGPITQKALRLFQSMNQLPSFGFFGPMTMALLNK